MSSKIDITPKINIYKTFRAYDYKSVDAISELIDNATQSFKDKKAYFASYRVIPKIYFFYNYDEKWLLVLDNCFGIDENNLDRVIQLNMPSSSQKSRNQFGMGLKTASFWFGEKLSIITKNPNYQNTFCIRLDLEELDSIVDNMIPVDEKSSSYFKEQYFFDFGTAIFVEKLAQKITKPAMKNLSKKISSKYRDDILNDKLELRIIRIEDKQMYDCSNSNEEPKMIKTPDEAIPLSFKWPKIYTDKNNIEYKINIDDSFEFDGKEYKIKGWIGVAQHGSRSHPGITLSRYKRTIKGDDEDNQWKPKKIFKTAASYEWQRVIGFLECDDFPVTQQKNDFDWNNGLEECFIDFLYDVLLYHTEFNIFKIVKMSRKEESSISRQEIVNDKFVKDLHDKLESDNNGLEICSSSIDYSQNNEGEIKIVLKDDKRKFHQSQVSYTFFINVLKNDFHAKWLSIEEIKDNKTEKEYRLNINLDLAFFNPFNNDMENVRDQFLRFIVYFSYATIIHKNDCNTWDFVINILSDLFSDENVN